jgi:hypothetical protein
MDNCTTNGASQMKKEKIKMRKRRQAVSAIAVWM